MAKRVFPIHLDKREREILRRMSERDGVSMAEVVRRSIRTLAVDFIEADSSPERAPVLESSAAASA